MGSIVDFANDLEKFSYTDYCKTTTDVYAIVMILHLGTIVYVLNKLTNDYSWVDRIWSILPFFFSLHILYHQTHCDNIEVSQRQWMMLTFITIWGLRLSYNFYRKGGYTSAGQDYRWIYLRKNYPKMMVELLTFFFTSYYQIILIYWFTSPIEYAKSPGLSTADYILAGLWILLFVGEVISDEQQWNFQTTKYRMLAENDNQLSALPYPYKRGFVTDGLYKYSRHPNFFCEFMMWWVMFGFSVVSQGLNMSGMGALLLTLLFIGSTELTELISSEKYPTYKQYQKTVSKLIPSFSNVKDKIQ